MYVYIIARVQDRCAAWPWTFLLDMLYSRTAPTIVTRVCVIACARSNINNWAMQALSH